MAAALSKIGDEERRATREMVHVLEDMTRALGATPGTTAAEGWVPRSFRAQDAYRVYSEPVHGFVTTADRLLLADTARADCQPGLQRAAFNAVIRTRLLQIPFVSEFVLKDGDAVLRCVDVCHELDRYANDDYSMGRCGEHW